MRTKRSATGLIAKTMATGALMVTALTVPAPDVFYDMRYNAGVRPISVTSATTSATPDVFYDM
jgi:hypothetical protein